ncbi:MAG: hypothetical protein PUB63_07260 [Clostridia bacterium]|nr:hypothetical protein [Clostridia bacterium]
MDETVVREGEAGADTKYVQMKTYRKTEIIKYGDLADLHQDFKGLVRLEDGSVRAVYQISSRTNPKTGEIQHRFKLESPAKGNASTYVEETMKAKTTAIPKAEWKKAWAEETGKAPEYNEGILHLLTGTLLPIWDRLPANNTRVMRVISSDGRQFLGRVIRPTEIDGVLRGLGTKRTMQTYTPQQIVQSVMQEGKEAVLRDNKLRITRRRVSGEWRMEISGQNIWYIARQYTGLISERINYEYRYFIPTGEKGEAILAEITKTNPVVDVRKAAPDSDVQYMKETVLTNDKKDHPERWTTTRAGDPNKTPMRLSDIIEKIRHDFGINITTGHVGPGARAQYDKNSKGVRTKIANSLPDVSHELGHHLDNVYGLLEDLPDDVRKELVDGLDDELRQSYPNKLWESEGLAEYIRKFLQNHETAVIDYPQFTKHFLLTLSGKDQAQLLQLADEVNAYYSMDADTAASSIRLREEGTPDARTRVEKFKDKAASLYQAWIDANYGIKRFDKATGADTYKLASNAAYSDAIAGNTIFGELRDANGQYVGPGLHAALSGLNMQDQTEYVAFGEYLVVKHGPERLAEGMRIFADDRKNSTQWMNDRQAELEAQYPQFEEISDRLYEFIEQLYQTWGVGTGLIGQETLDEWRDRWKYYVPFNRAVSEKRRGMGAKRGFANQDSTVKRAHGSGLDIVHPVDNIVNNIVKLVNAGVRNNVMRAITDSAEALGAEAAFLEKIPMPKVKRGFDMTGVKMQLTDWFEESDLTKDDKTKAAGIVASLDDILYQYGKGKAHGDVITVMKDGSQQFWKINDPMMLESITNLSPKKMEGIMDAYAVVSRFMTSNITGNNVIWSIFSNAPRDLMTTFFYSKNKNPVKLIASIGSAYMNRIKDGLGQDVDPLYQEFLSLGGGQTSAYTADRDLAKRARKKLAGENISANPLDWIAFVSDTVESGPRFATYKLMREAGMTPQEAFYEAMDITVNFRRGGRLGREANKFIPFFNAGVQGVDKFARWISADDLSGDERKKAVASRTFAFVMASAILAAIAYAINNRDDEDKENYQQLSSFTKNSYWCFPMGDGKYFVIPKPRELAVLSSFFETCMEYGIGENDHAFDEFYAYAATNFLPGVISDFAKGDWQGAIGSLGLVGVGAYMMANRDFLGRPIVSSGLQNLEPKDQYTERTSRIAYRLGQTFNISPQMIDYFGDAVFGGWSKYQRALWPVGEQYVDKTLGVKGSYVKDSQYSTDLVNWMYDKASASQSAKNSDPSNMEKAITAKMDNNMTSFYSRYYGQAKNTTETEKTRGVRQTVLDMIREYQKASDHGELTAAQEAVYAVCEKAGSTEYLPSVMQVSIKDGSGRAHELSAIQYVEYQTDYNRLYWEYVEDNLSKTTKENEKASVLLAAKKVAKEQATNRALGRIGAKQTDFAQKYSGVSDRDIIHFEAKIDLANDDGGLKQSEVIDIISAMITGGLSYDDAYTLFHSRYDSDKNNPWVK